MSEPKHLLHVFSTFVPAGPQVRTAKLMEAFGDEFRHTLVAMDGKLEARELVPSGVDITYLDAPPRAGTLRTLPRMRSLVGQVDPDLVLTYNWGALDTVLACRIPPRRTFVHHEDGFRPDEAHAQKARRVLARRAALSGASKVVVISKTLERIALGSWKLKPSRLAYIPNGIELERFEARDGHAELRDSLGIPLDAFVLGAVGHLRPEKNIPRLLQVLDRRPDTLDAHLLLLGDGPERAAIETMAAELELSDRVHFAGYQQDPRPYYRAMDIFCLTSNTEQMPIALLEAMASSLAVLSTDVGDVRDMVDPHNQEFVVPLPRELTPDASSPGTPDESTTVRRLTDSLRTLAGDPVLRAQLGRLHRERAAELYSHNGMVDAYRTIYRRPSGLSQVKG